MVENTADQEVLATYLIVDGEVVYEVAPNSVLNIGRLDSNDVVLDDYKVSREHAILKFSGTEFLIVDLASTHGTYVNDERVDRRIVNFGDKIRIVSHELTLSRELPDVEGSEGLSIPTPKMARTLDRRLKFFGGLNEFSLLTLVQFLSQEKQSGLLLLELGQKPGPRMYFVDGEIIHVADGADLAELLTRQYHQQSLFFYFHHETNFPARTIHEATPNYLMKLCHSFDEKQVRETDEVSSLYRSTGRLAVTRRIDAPPPTGRR
ncbi:MAG: FHA domain-containing protein [Methylacidiphilales bacterium]|nr:FHA domain-containing protein [Candidatus Methylacidiphilales bacterium]